MEFFSAANYQKSRYFIYAFLVVYLVIVTYTLSISNQSLGWDASMGIKMTENAEKKIPFNYYQHPSPGNLDKDETEFVTWWSPGQFALPLLIKTITGFKIGTTVKILTLICMLISALGIYKLYDHLIAISFSSVGDKQSLRLIAFTALTFLIMQLFFWGNIYSYNGGGLLMLAYCPWFIYWVIKIKQLNLYIFFGLLIAAFIGFFLKGSFTSILLGTLLYLFLAKSIVPEIPFKKQNFKLIIKNGIILAGVLVTYVLITKICFLSHNKSISDSSMGIRIQPRVILYPVVAPVLGVLGFDFLNKTYQWIIASLLIIPFYYIILTSKNITIHYKTIFTGFLGASVIFFSFLYFLNVDVSFESRHYIVISILILPAFFIAFHKVPIIKYVLGLVFGLILCLNIYLFTKQFLANLKKPKLVATYSGFHSLYPNSVIDKIHSLDSVKNHSIFYFQRGDPGIALEVHNNRILFEDNFINFHFDNELRSRKTLYFGRNSGEIYVVYEDSQIKTDSVRYLTKFEKYKKFDPVWKSDGYTIFRAIPSN